MAKKDTVLLDFDGTVMNTNKVIIDSWQHTFRTLCGKEMPEEDIIATFGEPLEMSMAKFFPDVPTDESIGIYRNYHWDNFGSLITLFPGMRELLAKLKSRGYKIGLVTSRLSRTTREGMEKYDISGFVDAIVTADDTRKHKPDPEPINMMLAKLGSTPESSIMVGDTMFDIKCARNAGVDSVLVGWAVAPSEEEISGDEGPDYIIEKAGDLLNILEEFEE